LARTGTPLGNGRQTVSGRPSTAQKRDPKADSETGPGLGRDRSCRTGAFPTRKPDLREMLRAEADYFERNRHRMRYPKSHEHGLFLGSAVIEAGCKAVIGSRLKPSGTFWTLRGAGATIALRCARLINKFEDYWASRCIA
jgi:hypothetical protein